MSPYTPETNENSEDEQVWKLLEASPRCEASPAFLQNTLRRVRLAKTEKPSAWWQKIFASRPLMATALGACAALAIFASVSQNRKNADPSVVIQKSDTSDKSRTDSDELIVLQDELSGELLQTAAENPDLFSDQEVFAFLD